MQILIFAVLMIIASVILFAFGWEVWEVLATMAGIITAILIFKKKRSKEEQKVKFSPIILK
jgi:positive regulator of sigma E activity